MMMLHMIKAYIHTVKRTIFWLKRFITTTFSNLTTFWQAKFKTVYFDTTLSKGIYHLNYSVNFTHYAFNGEYVGYENTQNKINEPILHKSGHKRHSIILLH